MKAKTFIATAIITSMLIANYQTCNAKMCVNKNNIIKSQVCEYKFRNINLDWWKSYNDEYLNEYIVKAINENQDLQIATLRVEEARQLVKLQFAKELPSAYIGVSPAIFKNIGVTNSEGFFAIPMIVNYEADVFLKNHDKTKSTKKSYEISKYNEKAIYITVASEIGTTYFNIIKLDKLIEIQEDIIKDRKQIFELMKVRNRLGITSAADETRAQKSYVMSVIDLTDLKKTREILLNALAVMIGESPNNINELKRRSYEELPNCKPIPNEIPSEIIMQRPDYMKAEKQVEKAGIDVRVAKKDFLPCINILGLVALATTTTNNSLNWSNAIAALGGAAMQPLFTGGAKFANLRLNKNRYEQALQNYYKTNLVAIREINDALVSLRDDNEKYENNLNSYDMQKKDYNYMKIRYKHGIISNLDLIQQKETLLDTNKLVISSRTDCFINQISLYKAVGGKL